MVGGWLAPRQTNGFVSLFFTIATPTDDDADLVGNVPRLFLTLMFVVSPTKKDEKRMWNRLTELGLGKPLEPVDETNMYAHVRLAQTQRETER